MREAPIIWAILGGFAIWIWALGLGRAGLRGVRDERDARWTRLFLGGMAAVTGAVLLFSSDPVIQVVSGVLAVGGVQVIRSARRLAINDQTNVVPLFSELHVPSSGARSVAREPIDVHPKRGWTIFVFAASIGTLVLLVFAGLEMWNRLPDIGWGVIGVAAFGAVLLLIPVFGLWWLSRVLRRRPFLRIDDWGITEGDDRARDPSIRWDEIARIEGRWVASNGLRDVLLLVHPRDGASLQRSGRSTRLMMAMSRLMYGAPIAISTMTLAIPREELIARLAAYYPGLRNDAK